MDKYRVRYSKTGKAKYISHLDLVTTMQRSFIRAGVSLKYSEGFNPHPYISVALPLPVGAESTCELMDTTLSGGGLQEKINHFLPEGLQIIKTYRAFRSFSDIKWVEAIFRIHFNSGLSCVAVNDLEECFTAKSLCIDKKTKSGERIIDAALHIRNIELCSSDDGIVYIKAKISAQNPTIGQRDIMRIIEKYTELPVPNIIEMKRIENYDTNMVLFN